MDKPRLTNIPACPACDGTGLVPDRQEGCVTPYCVCEECGGTGEMGGCDEPEPAYHDIDGQPCTLDALCRREPEWAATRIRGDRARVAALRRRSECRRHLPWCDCTALERRIAELESRRTWEEERADMVAYLLLHADGFIASDVRYYGALLREYAKGIQGGEHIGAAERAATEAQEREEP